MALAATTDGSGPVLDSLAAVPVCGNAVCETGERPVDASNGTAIFGEPVFHVFLFSNLMPLPAFA